jgi:hypothetical protein
LPQKAILLARLLKQRAILPQLSVPKAGNQGDWSLLFFPILNWSKSDVTGKKEK